jgi:hypothetical protein
MSEPGPAACSILASKAPAPTTRFNVTLPGIPLIVPPFFASRTPLAALSESRDMSYIPGVGPDTGGGPFAETRGGPTKTGIPVCAWADWKRRTPAMRKSREKMRLCNGTSLDERLSLG